MCWKYGRVDLTVQDSVMLIKFSKLINSQQFFENN